MIAFVYPLVLIIGVYIIVFGHVTPGGGFQGGALLATVFICRYLETPQEDIEIKKMLKLEKMMFIAIILLPSIYLFLQLVPVFDRTNIVYLVCMNALIGLKVCIGLSIIFYRFVFYEGGNKWRL
jgi:multicomponent Na+:H+ antiporter subunit B